MKYFSDLPTVIFFSTLPKTDIYFIILYRHILYFGLKYPNNGRYLITWLRLPSCLRSFNRKKNILQLSCKPDTFCFISGSDTGIFERTARRLSLKARKSSGSKSTQVVTPPSSPDVKSRKQWPRLYLGYSINRAWIKIIYVSWKVTKNSPMSPALFRILN